MPHGCTACRLRKLESENAAKDARVKMLTQEVEDGKTALAGASETAAATQKAHRRELALLEATLDDKVRTAALRTAALRTADCRTAHAWLRCSWADCMGVYVWDIVHTCTCFLDGSQLLLNI